jgi:hypothetical protein
MPIFLIIFVLSVVLIGSVFLDLQNETVDPRVTVEFRSDRYVRVLWTGLRKRLGQYQTIGLASNSENPYI